MSRILGVPIYGEVYAVSHTIWRCTTAEMFQFLRMIHVLENLQ